MEVAGHPIGASHKHFGLASVFEARDAAVLEETTDDAAHADAMTDAAHTGTQGTDAANQEIDLDAGLGSTIEGLNHFLIDQGVHLGNDASGAAFAGVLGFAFDKRK